MSFLVVRAGGVVVVGACVLVGECRREPSPPQIVAPPTDAGVFTAVSNRPPAWAAPPAPVVVDVPPPPPSLPTVQAPPPRPAPVVNPEPEELPGGGFADLPNQPITCAGDRVIFLDRVSIDNPSGAAVRASGRCAVRISNCTLRGDRGVVATERATVHLTRCRITGSTYAVDAAGSAAVRLTSCALAGATRQTGRATIDGSR